MASIKVFALIACAALVMAIVFPLAMQQIIINDGTNVSGTTYDWNSAVLTLWRTLLPVLAVIGIALYFIPKTKG